MSNKKNRKDTHTFVSFTLHEIKSQNGINNYYMHPKWFCNISQHLTNFKFRIHRIGKTDE